MKISIKVGMEVVASVDTTQAKYSKCSLEGEAVASVVVTADSHSELVAAVVIIISDEGKEGFLINKDG